MLTRDVVGVSHGDRDDGAAAMNNEVWVLGASGRTGRAVAARLHQAGVPLVLVGRDRERLEVVAAGLGGAPRLLVGPLPSVLAKLAEDPPGVVVNTIGPFTATATQVAGALPAGTHYVDVSNELPAAQKILALDAQAVAKGQMLVTGAGFGVLATESVVLRLCNGQPPAARVRVDALASVATEAGVLGSALAATMVEIISSGGREVRHGRLVGARVAAHPRQLTTPDGEVLATRSGPSGELLAAWRASNADSVIVGSALVPTNRVVRAVLPALAALFRLPGVSRLAVNRLARIPVRAHDKPRPCSWAHARAEWPTGTVREGWLRTGDGHDFTAAAAAEVTRRLLNGQGQPGTYTPGALYGPELAEAAGGQFLIDQGLKVQN